jgi:hypothetical protein
MPFRFIKSVRRRESRCSNRTGFCEVLCPRLTGNMSNKSKFSSNGTEISLHFTWRPKYDVLTVAQNSHKVDLFKPNGELFDMFAWQNGYVTAPQCYITRTLPVLSNVLNIVPNVISMWIVIMLRARYPIFHMLPLAWCWLKHSGNSSFTFHPIRSPRNVFFYWSHLVDCHV